MKMKTAFLALCASAAAFAGGLDDLHAPWQQILSKIVKEDRVDYAAAKADLPAVNGYLKSLSIIDSNTLKAAPAAQQNAVWLNAFNAAVVELIASNPGYPSIADIPHWRDSARFEVAGRPISLREIQDTVLLLNTKDARYWFCMTDGTISAAPLIAEAYTSANLEEKLTENVKAFMANPARLKVDAKAIHVQKNFDWLRVKPYFKKTKGGVDFPDFLAKYGPVANYSSTQILFDIPENYAKNSVAVTAPTKAKKGKKK